MQNLMLRQGTEVKALRDLQTATGRLVKGQKYTVQALPDGGLGVTLPDGAHVALTDRDGALTDACDAVTVPRLDGAALPRGFGQ